MLVNYKQLFTMHRLRLLEDIENNGYRTINDFTGVIVHLVKNSDLFKQDKDEEYDIDRICVNGLKQLIDDLYSVNSKEKSIFQLTKSDYCELKILKYVMENIDKFWDYIYGLSKSSKILLTKEQDSYVYNGNIGNDCYNLAKDLYSTGSIKFSSQERERFINSTLSDIDILNIKRRTLKLLKDNYSACRKAIMNRKVNTIANCARFLNKYGYLEYYITANNNLVRRLNMPYLEVNIRKSKKDKPLTCVSDYLDKDILCTLPDEEISALSLFMVNRVEKVKNKIIEVLMALTFLSDKTKNSIDSARWINIDKLPHDEIVDAIARYNMLTEFVKEQRHTIDKYDNTTKEYTNNDSLAFREVDLTDQISSEFTDEYNKEYNRFPQDNMLLEDLTRLISADNFQIFYDYKDSLIDILLISIISSNININWGIVPNDVYGFVDENNQILLSFDFPGYNVPIRCHANLNKVLKVLADMTGNTIIPLYLGNTELLYRDTRYSDNKIKPYPAYIPFKLSKEQKEAVKEDSMNGNNSIAKHIAMMQNVLSTTKLKREENRFVDLLSFTEDIKVNPSVKSYK